MSDCVHETVSAQYPPDFYTKKTNICCFWCCHPFDTPPFGIPIKYRFQKATFRFAEKERFILRGVYCSVECALADNWVYNDYRVTERQCWIKMLAKRLGNIPLDMQLQQAPPRRALEMFGGTMDIATFRKNNCKIIRTDHVISEIIPEESSILAQLKSRGGGVPSLPIKKRRKKEEEEEEGSNKKEERNLKYNLLKSKKSNPTSQYSLSQLGIKIQND